MGKPWEPAQIYDALRRRGLNLTQMARDAGLYESACREAMSIKGNRRGESEISKALDAPLWDLFPKRYEAPEGHDHHRRNTRGAERQKSPALADRERASA